MQVDDLQAQLHAANAKLAQSNVEALLQQLHQTNELLVQKQAQAERSNGERAARIMALEQQLSQVRESPLRCACDCAGARSSAVFRTGLHQGVRRGSHCVLRTSWSLEAGLS